MATSIAILLFPQFQQLDVAGPLAVFEVAERLRPGSYRWQLVAARPGPVACSAGVPWPARALPRPSAVDLLLVAGGDGVDAACADGALLRWLQRVHGRAARSTSVCSGSLLLAAAGLLDGCRATTHWSRTRVFRQRHPQVLLQPDRIWVRDGRIWTSAGITAGIDLALALVGDDLGDAVARAVAQQLVVAQRRPGGQSQHSALLELQRPDGRFAALLDHVRQHLAERHAVDDLAARICMSPRHFSRAFVAETGASPAQAVQRLRLEAARAQLESGTCSVQQVALACGFGNAERMRRAFVRCTGQPPAALKRLRASPQTLRPEGLVQPA